MVLELVILAVEDGRLRILLGTRGLPHCALRGSESLDKAARELLEDEVAADHLYLEQLYTFAFPHSKSARVVVAYLALVRNARPRRPGHVWFAARPLPRLGPEQRSVAAYGLTRLRNKITYTNLAFAFLPDRFTLSDLQSAYEVILGKGLDKRNFRKKILSLDILGADGQARRGGRPARLYQFTGSREVSFLPSLGPSSGGS
jgi:8-oxo-dGTP diphosphatase